MSDHRTPRILTRCRLCASDNLVSALELKPTALCDAYLIIPRQQTLHPLELLLCHDCGFVQLSCVVDPEEIYRDYIFVTTSSSPLQQHFSDYAEDVLRVIGAPKGLTVVDVGSNDGTLLKHFKKRNCEVLGIEPAREIALQAAEEGIPTVPEFLSPASVQDALRRIGPADLITVNNLFANVDDLVEFVDVAKSLLKKNGYIVIESSYLKDMIDNMVFDFIYHEHLSYFSVQPLAQFFNRQGMTLVDAVPVTTKGGSLRYFVKYADVPSEVSPRLIDLIEKEERIGLSSLSSFKRFQEKILRAKDELTNVLGSYAKNTVIGYGASATSTTLIEMFELRDKLSMLVDDFEAKQGTYSPGAHIPVCAPSEMYRPETEVVVILAWRYAEQIVSQHKGFKGRFIVPLPTLRVIEN